ncbi:MAG: hypothetical protein MUP98_03255 [Candidatus Aminicenantes bacterium]|nr:hypothetical protein [Candidatus Aminicenantes bacterium]
MYEQYFEHKKKKASSYLKKLFFLIPIGLLIYMFHLDYLKIKNSYKKIELEQLEFLDNFDVVVFESGYLKKRSDVQEIYVPTLAVRVTNLSEKEHNNLVFYATFSRAGKSFCRGSATLSRLKPLETKDIYLRCVDSVIIGSVVSGLSLMDTFGEVQYIVALSHDRSQLTVAEGKLDFTVFFP